MIRYLNFIAVTCVLAFAAPVLAVQDDLEPNGAVPLDSGPTLVVGSVAPDLDVEHWLSRGTDDKYPKVTKFEPGKVYVVEFWATWCPPCVASMPHLSKLQEKYADSVQVISISDEPLKTVEAFLERKVGGGPSKTYAQLTGNYCLTTDPDESSNKSYTEASGVTGIPAAYLIGKTGKIEWMGHPMEIDEPLELVVTDKFDAMAYQKEQQRREKLQEAVGGVFESVQRGKADEALKELDAIIAGATEEEQQSLQFLRIEILDAVGKPDLAIKQIDQMLTKASGEEAIELKMRKFQVMVTEKMPETEKLFFELADLAKEADLQNSVAWSVVEMNLEGMEVSPKMLTKARVLADAAVAAQPVADVLETQAHLVFHARRCRSSHRDTKTSHRGCRPS